MITVLTGIRKDYAMLGVGEDTEKDQAPEKQSDQGNRPDSSDIVPVAVEGLAITMRMRHGDNLPDSVTSERLFGATRAAIQRFLQTGNLTHVCSWTTLFNDVFDVWRDRFDTRAYSFAANRHQSNAVMIENFTNVDQVYHLYGSLSEGGQVRAALDNLINNPDLDQRVSYAVRKVVDDLRANERIKHTTRYEYVLMVLLLQPNEPIPIKYLSKFFEGSPNPEQSVRNLLGRLNDKLQESHVAVQHTSAYQLSPIP